MELKIRVCLPGSFLVKQRNETELTGNGNGGAFFNFIVRKNEPETGELVSFGLLFLFLCQPASVTLRYSTNCRRKYNFMTMIELPRKGVHTFEKKYYFNLLI